MAAINWQWLIVIIEVVAALGAVIFVHELGHFLVAKACGVKCEKFYLGFDVYGLKLAKFQWGETEYGIGLIPLGGYVKMLGQEDNPAKVQEELERARVTPDGSPSAADAEPEYDPRSYMAKSVPKRMAIISAGVVMNVIFAFLVAIWAYKLGVKTVPCVISHLNPGGPAWRAGLQPGDEIIRIGNIDRPRFQDLKSSVTLGDMTRGVDMVLDRPGVPDPIAVTVFPENQGQAPEIGVHIPFVNTLSSQKAAWDGTPAAAAEPPLVPGDEIVSVNGQPVATYAELEAQLAQNPEVPLTLRLARVPGGAEATAEQGAAKTEEVEVVVAPNPMRTMGLAMNMGKIVAVQPESPAAAAGLKEGDFIVSVGDTSPVDPFELPDQLRRLAGQTVKISVSREGFKEPLELEITPRQVRWYEFAAREGLPLSAPALGIAYRVVNRVQAAYPDSPAAKAGLVHGDQIVKAELVPAKENAAEERERGAMSVDLGDGQPNWPYLMFRLQNALPDTKVRLTLGDQREVELDTVVSTTAFNPARGLVCDIKTEIRKAGSLGEAVSLARRETWDSLTLVYRSIQRLAQGQVSPKMLAGPIEIAKTAGYAAYEGLSQLLLFLTLISANLAVINFLPIPLLDGGHMVFLAWEGIRGKPASERVILAFHYVGFCFLIGLMMWVLYLDVGRSIGSVN
jgi:regulator of sigma E protease